MRAVVFLTAIICLSLTVPFVSGQGTETGPPPAPRKIQGPEEPSLQALPSVADEPAVNQPRWRSIFDDMPAARPGRSVDPLRNSRTFSDPFFQRQPRGSQVIDPFAMLHQEMERMHQLQDQMHEQMNQLMQQGPGPHVQTFDFSTSGGEMEDRGDHYQIVMELRGLDESSADIDIEGNQLVLRCRVNHEVSNTDASGRVISRSRVANVIQQRWTLPPDVDTDGVETQFDAERLVITLPRDGSIPRSRWSQ